MANEPAIRGNVEHVPVDRLTPHPANPREGDIGAIAESIRMNGWFGTIVAQTSTGHVIAGNHRLEAARLLGMEEVPVFWADVDDNTARRMLLADNRTSDLATYNLDLLADILREAATVDTLAGTGFDPDDLDSILDLQPEPPQWDEPPAARFHRCPSCGYGWQA
jgi:ParB-like chromosome segregation protein Spo0J